MKQILVMMAVVVVVGCGSTKVEPPQASEAEPQVVSKPTPVSPADEKLIADPIVEKEVRRSLKKPEGELTEADLEKVTFFDLAGSCTDEGLKEVAKLQNLEGLTLHNTQITDEGLKEAAKLQKLKELNLGGTLPFTGKTTDKGLKEVAKLQKLEQLWLSGTQITDEGLKEVAKLQNLERLSLNATKVTDEGLKEVAKLQMLQQLYLPSQITDGASRR